MTRHLVFDLTGTGTTHLVLVGGFTVVIMQVSVQIGLNLTGLELSLAIILQISNISASFDLYEMFNVTYQFLEQYLLTTFVKNCRSTVFFRTFIPDILPQILLNSSTVWQYSQS